MIGRLCWLLAGLPIAAAVSLAVQGSAGAHPLGNFTVNHYDGLRLHQDGVEVSAVVDIAEIPTLQERPRTDTNHDNVISQDEAKVYAADQCRQIAAGLTASVDDRPLTWTVASQRADYPEGQAGLPTTRITCQLTAATRFDHLTTLRLRDSFRGDRVGWHEMTAVGDGVALLDSPVPADSISQELRSYPNDLLSAPLDVRDLTLRVRPGSGPTSLARQEVAGVGVMDKLVGRATATFASLAGSRDLTPLVGGLALLLSLVLGASHAALPGHGKTVMAAYLAGKRGSTKDAVMVGATVTITHTAGVLLLGMVVSLSSVVAGEGVLRWLGVASGLLVAGIGAGLLRTAARHRTGPHLPKTTRVPVLVEHGTTQKSNYSPRASAGHGHGHGHGYGHGQGNGFGRSGLVGMGIAGGLVPSPSALVVLLGAIALGRTWFGVLLVLGYGLGMAATLTAAGLLLVRLRDRLERLDAAHRFRRRAAWFSAVAPMATAALVLVVGLGLAVRAAVGIV